MILLKMERFQSSSEGEGNEIECKGQPWKDEECIFHNRNFKMSENADWIFRFDDEKLSRFSVCFFEI